MFRCSDMLNESVRAGFIPRMRGSIPGGDKVPLVITTRGNFDKTAFIAIEASERERTSIFCFFSLF